jgi:hypothetical protein
VHEPGLFPTVDSASETGTIHFVDNTNKIYFVLRLVACYDMLTGTFFLQSYNDSREDNMSSFFPTLGFSGMIELNKILCRITPVAKLIDGTCVIRLRQNAFSLVGAKVTTGLISLPFVVPDKDSKNSAALATTYSTVLENIPKVARSGFVPAAIMRNLLQEYIDIPHNASTVPYIAIMFGIFGTNPISDKDRIFLSALFEGIDCIPDVRKLAFAKEVHTFMKPTWKKPKGGRKRTRSKKLNRTKRKARLSS